MCTLFLPDANAMTLVTKDAPWTTNASAIFSLRNRTPARTQGPVLVPPDLASWTWNLVGLTRLLDICSRLQCQMSSVARLIAQTSIVYHHLCSTINEGRV